ncbi:carboxymuconolactone decarboxylase family protein [Maribacter polysaccharolyticus]|uniref:carboxymuconolactone decarboxylase family protein n=1 Tax=Maribacter polysaccharolyticus TaxID=3020831 RepID=UPI00237F28FE|nr:carboxymuconolactone decarboxylase family protein [Maribacter polysaccharolyticus]MDE3742554.1 carboxymuconolactone decarboxylase family protein [Maribacter polysaccharolyticus]
MLQDYPKKFNDLSHQMTELGIEIPDTMKGFSELHHASLSKGALTSKTKELIALGIAITIRCEGCIACHVHDALQAGAKHEEIMETIGVSVLMGGGPSVVYGCEAMEALKQFGISKQNEAAR